MQDSKNLNKERITFYCLGTKNKELEDLMNYMNHQYSKYVSKTDLINIALDLFLKRLQTDDKTIEDYLIEYNLL